MAKDSQTEQFKLVAMAAAEKHGFDSEIFARQIQQESGFNPNALSPKGAIGIAQIMPGTARGWKVDPTDPYAALDAAAKNMASYKRTYMKQGKSDSEATALALAAYNAGPGAVAQYGGVPPYKETQNYVKKIMGSGGPQSTKKTSTTAKSGGQTPANIFQGMPMAGLVGQPQMKVGSPAEMLGLNLPAPTAPAPLAIPNLNSLAQAGAEERSRIPAPINPLQNFVNEAANAFTFDAVDNRVNPGISSGAGRVAGSIGNVLAGAGIGSLIPGLGTGVGALIGSILAAGGQGYGRGVDEQMDRGIPFSKVDQVGPALQGGVEGLLQGLPAIRGASMLGGAAKTALRDVALGAPTSAASQLLSNGSVDPGRLLGDTLGYAGGGVANRLLMPKATDLPTPQPKPAVVETELPKTGSMVKQPAPTGLGYKGPMVGELPRAPQPEQDLFNVSENDIFPDTIPQNRTVQVNEQSFKPFVHGDPKPRVNSVTPKFESDVDRALYIIANRSENNRSFADDKFFGFAREVFPNLKEDEIIDLATRVKQTVVNTAKEQGDSAFVPKTFRGLVDELYPAPPKMEPRVIPKGETPTSPFDPPAPKTNPQAPAPKTPQPGPTGYVDPNSIDALSPQVYTNKSSAYRGAKTLGLKRGDVTPVQIEKGKWMVHRNVPDAQQGALNVAGDTSIPNQQELLPTGQPEVNGGTLQQSQDVPDVETVQSKQNAPEQVTDTDSRYSNTTAPKGWKHVGTLQDLQKRYPDAAELTQGQREFEVDGERFVSDPSSVTRQIGEVVEHNLANPQNPKSIEATVLADKRTGGSLGKTRRIKWTPTRFIEGKNGIGIEGITPDGGPRTEYLSAFDQASKGIISVDNVFDGGSTIITNSKTMPKVDRRGIEATGKKINSLSELAPDNPKVQRLAKMFSKGKTADFKAIKEELRRLEEAGELDDILNQIKEATGGCV